ncbi:MAG: AgmX/PglI C-terminal domain-containing protein [Polyangiaceae bacterium]|nr:AgmX/PglI C-terminal domain-containing protein [Polyangiaceae bacterium]
MTLRFLGLSSYAIVLGIALTACGMATPPTDTKTAAIPPPDPTASTNATDNPLPPPDVVDEKAKDKAPPVESPIAERKDAMRDEAKEEIAADVVLGLLGAPITTAEGGAPPPPHGFGVAGPANSSSRSAAGTTSTGTVNAATEVRGSLDKEEIRRVVRRHLNEIKFCYEQGLTRRPDLEGRLVVKFTIGKTGSVVSAIIQDSTLGDRQVEQCIASAVMRWVFPKPAGEGLVVISYPFVLKPGS